MGKALIINGADFSLNAVEQINTDTIQQKKSQRGVMFLDYQEVNAIRQVASNSPTRSSYEVLVADVQNFVGQQVRITTANPIVSDAYYACFASDLGDLAFNDIPNLAVSSTTQTILHNITKIGDSFNISTIDGVTSAVTKTVPANAKYLVVTGAFTGDLTESNFKVEFA